MKFIMTHHANATTDSDVLLMLIVTGCAVVQKGATAYHLYVTKTVTKVAAHLLRAYKQYS